MLKSQVMRKFIVYTVFISMTILFIGDFVYAYRDFDYSGNNVRSISSQSKPINSQLPKSTNNDMFIDDINSDEHEMLDLGILACLGAYAAVWGIMGTAIALRLAASACGGGCSCGCGSSPLD